MDHQNKNKRVNISIIGVSEGEESERVRLKKYLSTLHKDYKFPKFCER